jgi:hypothetical protein
MKPHAKQNCRFHALQPASDSSIAAIPADVNPITGQVLRWQWIVIITSIYNQVTAGNQAFFR